MVSGNFYFQIKLLPGASVKKYCLDMAFQKQFEYLEDVIFTFQMLPTESFDGCRTIGSNSTNNTSNESLMETKNNETLTICICDQDKCNSAKQTRIGFTFSAILTCFVVNSAFLFGFFKL